MKKNALIVFILASLCLPLSAYAAEDMAPVEPAAVDAAEVPAPAEEAFAPAAPDAAPVEADAALEAPVAPENLEFVSGEVTALDEAAKKVTVKLYGETEETKEKAITIEVDEATDITDGEKDRDLKSLAAGTEVDVEYDPATTKATYIFVY